MYVRININDDQATPCINLVDFDQYLKSSTVYNRRRSMTGYVYLRLPGGSTVKFRYYLLGGDTVAPSGLYARLCHAFLVSIIVIINVIYYSYYCISANGSSCKQVDLCVKSEQCSL